MVAKNSARADDAAFIGTFNNDDLSITLKAAGNGYEGTITKGSDKFPVRAISNDTNLQGTFNAGGTDYQFNGTLKDNHLTLSTGGKTYELTKAGAASSAPTGTATGTVVLQRQMIHDDFVNKDAYSVAAPKDWKIQGQITWVPGRPVPDVYIVASNPDNTVAFQQIPTQLYQANMREMQEYMFPAQTQRIEQQYAEGQTFGLQHIEVRRLPESMQEYVQGILIPKSFAGMAQAGDLKVVSATDMPDYAKAAQDKDPGHRESKAGRVRVTYTTPKGPMEAEFVTLIQYTPIPLGQGRGQRPKQGPVLWIVNTYVYRAPAAQFDAALPTLSSIHSSVQVQLPWFNVMQQMAAEMLTALQQAEISAIIGQGQSILNNQEIMRKAAQEKSDMVSQEIHDRFAQTMATHDEMQTREMHYTTNTGNYRDPQTGGLVNLSEDYKYHFSDGNGHIIESQDANPSGFAPNELKPMDRVN
jgi:hypothetical protein